jgi:hypothetical protein
MQGWLRIIIAPPLNNMKAALETGESALIEVQFKTLPRIEAAEIKVPEDHPS